MQTDNISEYFVHFYTQNNLLTVIIHTIGDLTKIQNFSELISDKSRSSMSVIKFPLALASNIDKLKYFTIAVL
jgi:hypothetical protein